MSLMNKIAVPVFALMLASLLPGCAYSTKKMDVQAAPRIHTIALLDVPVPDETFYEDVGAIWLAGGGLVSVAVHEIATSDAKQHLAAALHGPVDVRRIIADELEAALKRQGYAVRRVPAGAPSYRDGAVKPEHGWTEKGVFLQKYSALPIGDADATLDAVCVAVGYFRFEFTQRDHPCIGLAVRLVAPDGRTEFYVHRLAFGLPHHRFYDTSIDATQQQFNAPWSEVFDNPQRLEEQLRIAARQLADSIARDIAAK